MMSVLLMSTCRHEGRRTTRVGHVCVFGGWGLLETERNGVRSQSTREEKESWRGRGDWIRFTTTIHSFFFGVFMFQIYNHKANACRFFFSEEKGKDMFRSLSDLFLFLLTRAAVCSSKKVNCGEGEAAAPLAHSATRNAKWTAGAGQQCRGSVRWCWLVT